MKRKKTIADTIRNALMIFTIFTSVTMAIVLAIMFTNVYSTEIGDRLQTTCDYYSQTLDIWLIEKETMVTGCKTAIEQAQLTDETMIRELLRGYYDSFADASVNDLFVGLANGHTISGNDNAATNKDATAQTWYKKITAAGKTVYLDPYVSVSGNGQSSVVATIGSPLKINGEQIGVIGMDIRIDDIAEEYTVLSYMEDLEGTLVDSAMNIVISPYDEYRMREDGYQTSFKAAQPSVTANIRTNNHVVMRYPDLDGSTKIWKFSKVGHSGWIFVTSYPFRDVLTMIIGMVAGIIGIAVICVVLSILASKKVSKGIMAPITVLEDFIKDRILGHANVQEFRKETQEIAFLVDEMQGRFIGTIQKTREESQTIETQINDASDRIADISSHIMTISSEMEQTGASIDTQTSSMAQISQDCTSVEHAIESFAQETEGIAGRSQEIIVRVTEACDRLIEDKANAVRVTRDSQQRLAEALTGLREIEKISEISDSIKTIAGQIKLLALNASIEAARAGDAGLGFAVVATEINTLSANTSAEIAKINSLIGVITDNAHILSEETNSILNFIGESVLKDYDKFEDMANSYKGDSTYYSESSQTLSAGIEELQASITHITATVGLISKAQNELSDSVQSVNDSLQQITSSSQDVSTATEEVRDSIMSLTETVGSFNI